MVPVGAGTDGKAGSCWSMDHCWDKSMSSLHLGLLAFFLPHCTCIGIYWKRNVVPVWSVFKNLATTQVQEWWHPTPKLDCMIASNLGEYLYGEGVWQLLYYFAEETGDPLLECIGEILERYWDDDVTWCVSWLIGDGYCICLAGVQMTHPTVEVPLWSCCFWDWFQGHWDGLAYGCWI